MGWLMNHLEMIAALCGLVNIYLIARASMWNWVFGIANVTLYMFIFFKVKLYADMSMQFIFLNLQFYGIYCWCFGGNNHSGEMIDSIKLSTAIKATLSFLILFISIAYILENYTDSTTVISDSITTAMSLVAQWMMSKKYIEHWFVWLVVNVISIQMYLVKSLYLTAGLYAVFIIAVIYGFITWTQILRGNPNKKILKYELSK